MSYREREEVARALAKKWPGDYAEGDPVTGPNALAFETADVVIAALQPQRADEEARLSAGLIAIHKATIDGNPIYWRDRQDFVHVCEGSDVHPGIRLIWTLCGRDVPASAAYRCDGDNVTCSICKVTAA